ncbi:MAG: DUF3997 domain-containing protein, partial [Bacteroidota bacterium]
KTKPNLNKNVEILLKKGFNGDNLERDQKILDEVSDSILRNNPNYRKLFENQDNYWVINKKNNIVFGPLTKEEYLLKRDKLHLSSILNLP